MLAFHIFKNLRLFDKKIVAGLHNNSVIYDDQILAPLMAMVDRLNIKVLLDGVVGVEI